MRTSAEELGIAECFEMVLPKPNVMLDDQPAAEWRCLLTIPPACRGLTVEEHRRRLG